MHPNARRRAVLHAFFAAAVVGWLACAPAACTGASDTASCGDPPDGFGCRSSADDCTPLVCNEGTWVCPLGSDEVAIATDTCDGNLDGGSIVVTSAGSSDASDSDACALPTDCPTVFDKSNCTYGPPYCEQGFGICGPLMCDTVLGEASADPVIDSGSGTDNDSSVPPRDASPDAAADGMADAPADG
jgi:hypothetical protein